MKKLLIIIAIVFATLGVAACSQSASDAAAEKMSAAEDAIENGRYDEAQTILNSMMERGGYGLSEENLGNLSVLFMRLSEHESSDDNVAQAVKCLREAYRISEDSLRTFSASIPPEDLSHFYLLRRIVWGIDNPVDLTDEIFVEEDSVDAEHQ